MTRPHEEQMRRSNHGSSMSKNWLWLSYGVIGAVLAACCGAFLLLRMPTIQRHQGDGTFRNLSFRYLWMPIPGYEISMDRFSLASPFRHEYRVSSLAEFGRECGVFLVITDANDEWWRRDHTTLEGHVAIQIEASDHTVVASIDESLGKLIWWSFDGLHAL